LIIWYIGFTVVFIFYLIISFIDYSRMKKSIYKLIFKGKLDKQLKKQFDNDIYDMLHILNEIPDERFLSLKLKVKSYHESSLVTQFANGFYGTITMIISLIALFIAVASMSDNSNFKNEFIIELFESNYLLIFLLIIMLFFFMNTVHAYAYNIRKNYIKRFIVAVNESENQRPIVSKSR